MLALTKKNLDKHIEQLPSLSVIVTRLLALLQGDNVAMLEIMLELGKDQGLTARVLRIANSPFYGLASKVSNIKHAGTLLGIHTLHGIITAAGIIDHFPPVAKNQTFDRNSFWLHSIGTGIAAQVLARRCGHDPEQAFTAGLLHDVGKLVLAVYFEQDFTNVLLYRDKYDCLIREAEEQVLGFDHTEIGSRVAKHWKLPTALISAIRFHHNLSEHTSVLAALVHVADILCRGLDIGHGGDNLIPILDENVLARLGFDWGDLKTALPEIECLNTSASMLLDES